MEILWLQISVPNCVMPPGICSVSGIAEFKVMVVWVRRVYDYNGAERVTVMIRTVGKYGN